MIGRIAPSLILISPGPGRPADFGVPDVIENRDALAYRLPHEPPGDRGLDAGGGVPRQAHYQRGVDDVYGYYAGPSHLPSSYGALGLTATRPAPMTTNFASMSVILYSALALRPVS